MPTNYLEFLRLLRVLRARNNLKVRKSYFYIDGANPRSAWGMGAR